MRPEVRGGVATRRGHDAGHVLERRHPGPGGGEGVDLAEMRGHGEAEGGRLVQERSQQVGRELGVDLNVVCSCHRAQIHGPAHLGGRSHRGRCRIGRTGAVDHSTRGEHPRTQHRAQVEVVLERYGGVGAGRAEVADRGDAPGEVALGRPPLDVRMGVDQPRDDRLADEVHHLRAARHPDFVHAGHGLDVPVLDEDQRVLDRLPPRSVDQGRTLEGDHAVAGGVTGGEREDEEQEAGMRDARCAMRHLGSDDVWSCRICHRFPRFWRRSVNGPLAVTESPRRSSKRAVQSARSSVSGRTRTSLNASESRDLPGAKYAVR